MKNIILICSIFLCNNSICQETSVNIITKSYAKIKSKNSFHYTGFVRFKFFSDEDTIRFNGDVFLLRNLKDTINNCMLWYNYPPDSVYAFYDLKNIYQVNPRKKTATIYPADKNMWPMSGNVLYRVVCKELLDPKQILKYIEKDNLIKRLRDTIINNENCYTIDVKYPDEGDFINNETKLYISKKNYLPLLRKNIIEYQGNYQYYELYIKSYVFNNVVASKFSKAQIDKSYNIDIYVKDTINEVSKLLDSNSIAPKIIGKNYQLNESDDSISYLGKVTLLDFWYMECGPCISAIKEIENIKKIYVNKNLQIFGINSIDTKKNSIKRLPKFLEYNNMDYTIFFVDDNVAKNFRVQSWPSFYIIDQNGKIFYKRIGYDNDLLLDLKSHIDMILK